MRIKLIIRNNVLPGLMISVLVCFAFSCKNQNSTLPPKYGANSDFEKQINRSINRAVDYLYHAQLDYGEFKTYACSDIKMKDCFFDSSPFVTATILYSLKDIDTKKTRIIKRKAIDFLLSEQETGGIWRYWTSKNEKKLWPDLDDISLISFVLKINNIKFDNNINTIEKNRNSDGLFFTYINKNDKNEIDCTVNAQVLLYAGNCYPEVCNYLNNAIKNDEDCSISYPDRLFLYYYVARAIENGVTCLEESKGKILSEILKAQQQDGSFGRILSTALAINSLIIFNYYGNEIELAVKSLRLNQRRDGSWIREVAWIGPAPYYGSEELSTAISLEALHRFKISMQY